MFALQMRTFLYFTSRHFHELLYHDFCPDFWIFFGGGESFLRMLLSPAIHNIFAFSFPVFIHFMLFTLVTVYH